VMLSKGTRQFDCPQSNGMADLLCERRMLIGLCICLPGLLPLTATELLFVGSAQHILMVPCTKVLSQEIQIFQETSFCVLQVLLRHALAIVY